MKYYSYEDFRCDTKKLLIQVKEFEAEVIVGIARGGLTLSHALAEGMNIREVQTLRTELYDETCKRDMLSIFGDCNFRDISRVLVVDDISDSGDTLKAVMSHLKLEHTSIEFKSCTLFYKKTSVYEPHYWINEANDWIDFFWERDFNNTKI
ncbi:MAG: phosphoribosyltransferase [Epsilonproteobacteria bacterium]|nr:MAG: phosphoribosyltransferase [Campylobacterota bacterium]